MIPQHAVGEFVDALNLDEAQGRDQPPPRFREPAAQPSWIPAAHANHQLHSVEALRRAGR
jgi:hypothetical protein